MPHTQTHKDTDTDIRTHAHTETHSDTDRHLRV